jgi:ribosomal protein RSM22 (predicted rRNA methylase)
LLLDRALARLEQAAWRVARRSPGTELQPRALEAAIRELSALYNARDDQEAPGTLAPLRDPRLLAARLLFFTLADLPKGALALAELLGERADGPPLRLLDVGAGCGAMSLGVAALADALAAGAPAAPLEALALDADPAALALARELAAESGLPIHLEVRAHDLARSLERDGLRPPLIIAGSLLNELAPERRLALVEELLAHLEPGGALLLIEPATRAHSRSLLALRDRLLATGAASVCAPCTRAGPCPALDDPTDWCHECRLWTPPPELRALGQATGLRRRDLVYSFLGLRADGARPPRRPGAWRVVSAPLRSKGKHELYLCGEPGRRRATLLLRHRSESNDAFLRAERGQLLWLDGSLEETGPAALRLGAGSQVERVDPLARVLASD